MNDALFNEGIINNFDIKEEVIVGNHKPIEEIVNNIATQTLKPMKKIKKNINNESSNNHQEKDF